MRAVCSHHGAIARPRVRVPAYSEHERMYGLGLRQESDRLPSLGKVDHRQLALSASVLGTGGRTPAEVHLPATQQHASAVRTCDSGNGCIGFGGHDWTPFPRPDVGLGSGSPQPADPTPTQVYTEGVLIPSRLIAQISAHEVGIDNLAERLGSLPGLLVYGLGEPAPASSPHGMQPSADGRRSLTGESILRGGCVGGNASFSRSGAVLRGTLTVGDLLAEIQVEMPGPRQETVPGARRALGTLLRPGAQDTSDVMAGLSIIPSAPGQ